ncbi:MAG: hypothetical protein E7190_09180 [Erysipelotrichaceae bacterium]|nr:hypothetical protein [Erysipelotrichaceae bacterium]
MFSLKKAFTALTVSALAFTLTACGGSSDSSSSTASKDPVKIGIPDDATNGGRAIKLLETAGLISVNPDAGWVPELKDVTEYIYNIEIVPTTANTLPSTLDDFGASTINGTYAIPIGLVPSRDGLIVENQADAVAEGEKNPFINIIVARTEEKDNETFAKVVKAYNTDYVAQYILAKFQEASIPAWEWSPTELSDEAIVDEVDHYESSADGKTVVRVGVCGASNDSWRAVQKILDDNGDNIYIELVRFDAYTLPNEALNSGEIDLNSFQHYAYLEKEIASQGYDLTVIGDTSMAPLTLYSRKYTSLDELKEAAGKK